MRDFQVGVVVCEEVLGRRWTAVRSSLSGAVLLSGVTWQELYCCQGLPGRRWTAVRSSLSGAVLLSGVTW